MYAFFNKLDEKNIFGYSIPIDRAGDASSVWFPVNYLDTVDLYQLMCNKCNYFDPVGCLLAKSICCGQE